jgi:glycosyltransferase involved in cell wall biosynthesis
MSQAYKLAVLVSHPIQYFTPLFKRLAAHSAIDLTVFYLSDLSLHKYYDRGFGTTFKWDIPLLGGYRHIFLPHYGGNGLSFYRPLTRKLHRHLKNGRFDALWMMGWAHLTNLRALALARLLGIKVFIYGDSHAGGPGPYSAVNAALKRLIFPLFFRCFDGFFATCTANRDYYVNYGVPERRLFLTPYVVDNDFFRAAAEEARHVRQELRSCLGLIPGRPIILYASKFLTRKRPADLLEAYILLSPDGRAEPKPYLIFVGDGEEGPALKARASQTGWSSIRFLGFKNQSELPALFDLCDVFVLVPDREGLATVVPEVMNAGKPVVISEVVALGPDLVVDGDNGFIVPARSPAVLAERLRIITDDAQLAARMGARGLARIANWNIDVTVHGVLQALDATAPRRRSPRAQERSSAGGCTPC